MQQLRKQIFSPFTQFLQVSAEVVKYIIQETTFAYRTHSHDPDSNGRGCNYLIQQQKDRARAIDFPIELAYLAKHAKIRLRRLFALLLPPPAFSSP